MIGSSCVIARFTDSLSAMTAAFTTPPAEKALDAKALAPPIVLALPRQRNPDGAIVTENEMIG